jgi:hypothetical protein
MIFILHHSVMSKAEIIHVVGSNQAKLGVCRDLMLFPISREYNTTTTNGSVPYWNPWRWI